MLVCLYKVMNKKIIAGCIFSLGMVRAAPADDPPKIQFRLTEPTLRSLEPTPDATTVRQPMALVVDRTTPTETFTLAPGTYRCVPYSMIVVVPGPVDEGMIKRPGARPAARIFQPPVAFVPVQH